MIPLAAARRRLLGAALSVVVAAPLTGALPARAHSSLPAGPGQQLAAGAPCTPGTDVYTVKLTSREYRVTHLVKVVAPPKANTRFNETIPAFRAFTAQVKGTGDFSGQSVLDRVQRKFRRGIDGPAAPRLGDRTSTAPADLGDSLFRNRSNEVYKYAGFAARRIYTGTWARTECGASRPEDRGTYRTFDSIDLDGFSRCRPASPDTPEVAAEACRKVYR